MADVVEILLQLRNVRQFVSGADKASDAVGGIGKSADQAGKKGKGGWRNMAGWAGGGAAFAGVSIYAKQAIQGAVDLGEEVNKTGVVFRGNAPALINWSKGAATGLGMAQQEALSAMGTFGNMLVPMGLSRDRAAGMSQNMVKLAADMASFNNASPEETLQALRSGLAGESEPLRKFGVFLSDARLKQEAMNQGLYKGKGPLSAQAKAMATYALITKDTKDAQGDFARTSGGLANKQRILKAQLTQTGAQLGTVLLPVAVKLAGVLSTLLRHSTALYAGIGFLTAAFVAYKVAVMVATLTQLGFNTAMITTRLATLMASLAVMGLNASMLLIPLAVAAIILGVIVLYKRWGWFHNAVVNVWNWIKKNWPLLASILLGPFGIAVVAIIRNFDKIKSAARSVIATVRHVVGQIAGTVKAAFGSAGSFVSGIARGIADWLNAHTPFGDRIEFKVAGKSVGFNLPALATGGFIRAGGAAVVGERGPELVTLPTGSTVYPTPTIDAAAAAAGGGEGSQTIVTQVFLDRRQIAEAVGQYVADRKARR